MPDTACASLEAFLEGTLPRSEVRSLVSHLLSGCPACSEQNARFAAMLFRPGLTEPETDGSEYDFPIFRAFAAARPLIAGLRDKGRRGPARLWAVPEEPAGAIQEGRAAGRRGCAALIEAGRALRHRDPEGMVRWASAAAVVAERTEAAGEGPAALAELSDLRARAWAELANACRGANDLGGAEASLGRALEHAAHGTGDPSLQAKILDFAASLATSQRRFGEALRLLDAVSAVHAAAAEDHLAGRALISRGIVAGYANDLEEAVRLLAAGLSRIDHRDLQLVVSAVHSLLDFTVKLDRFEEGRRLLELARPLYAAYPGTLSLKLRWIEGRIDAGMGNLEAAEAALLEVREGFRRRALPYTVAVASLELAAVWLRRGRTAEVKVLVEEMLQTFRSLGIRREAIAALLLLRRAVAAEKATLGLLRTVAGELQRLEQGPAAGL